MEYKGIEYLRNKLNMKRYKVITRYNYYEMKNVVLDFNISTPPDLVHWQSVLGWCAKGVDSLADRLIFRGFRDDNFNIGEIFKMNNPDTFSYSVILSALISSCCFVYISEDEDGYPRLQVIDGGNATGVIDPITGLLNEGYAVLERDDYKSPILEAYFTNEETVYIQKGQPKNLTVKNHTGHALLVPIIYKPDAVRPFGHSRINRACMSLVESALRTIKRSEIAAEFYSYPQKYINGLSDDVEMDRWKATMSSMLMISQDEDGNHPTVGQFQQQSMTPHTEQLKMFAALFAGEMGLTLDDLGFTTENPSSAEAIKASHENLRLAARQAQRTFGSGILNVGFLAACMRDKYQYKRKALYLTTPLWEPIFEPDAAALSGIGDGAIKINQAIAGYFGKENLRDLTGISAEE